MFVRPLKKSRVKVLKCDQPNEDEHRSGYKLKLEELGESDAESSKSSDECDAENEFIVDKPANLLHLACTYADIPMISYALALEADPNSVLESESTHFNSGSTPLIKAVHSVSGSRLAVGSSQSFFVQGASSFDFRVLLWRSSYCY